MRIKPFDFVVLGLAAGITVLCGFAVYKGGAGKEQISIRSGDQSWIYPMDTRERVEIPGPLGVTVVELSDGGARVLSSPCANQICVAAGTVRRRGQWIACLPNGVVLVVEAPAAGERDVDSAAW